MVYGKILSLSKRGTNILWLNVGTEQVHLNSEKGYALSLGSGFDCVQTQMFIYIIISV